MPRNKKYDWADKKDICYRLWVEEEKSLPQVQEYFSKALGVTDECIPSYVPPLPIVQQSSRCTLPSIYAVTDTETEHKLSSASSRNGASHRVGGPGPHQKWKLRSSNVSSNCGN